MNESIYNRSITILIGEDEDYNFLLLRENFKLAFGKAVLLRAVNGEEVVAIALKNDNIDLILMDIRMPVMNGYEATIQIKKSKPYLPILAQTAYALSDDKARAILAGCDDYIAKPYEFEDLFAKVIKCINLYNKARL